MSLFQSTLIKLSLLMLSVFAASSVKAQEVVWHCSKYSSEVSLDATDPQKTGDGYSEEGEGDYDYIEETFGEASADLLVVEGDVLPEHLASDLFYLMSVNENVISVSVMDLYDVFSGGRTVFVGDRRLSACVLRDARLPINMAAFEAVGVQPHVVEQMVKRSSISQGFVRLVRTESEMASCIARYHPAVGYISQEVIDEAIAPCF